MKWFGELPAHWCVKRVRHIGTLKGGAGFPHEQQGRQDGELPFFKVKDLGDVEMPLVSTDNYVSRETATELRANVFPGRTIVFAKVGAALMLNRFRILGVPGCIDNNMMGLTIDEGVMTVRFALSALTLVDFKIVANPGAVPSVNEGQVSDYPLPVPPLNEQLAIADFLDREAARIDELVAAKQRVLDLIAEKRKAIIATAVTRGLDPMVELRDSGVPWLGEIPAHWSTPPVYARYEVQLGKMLDERQITKRFLAPYLRNTDVQWDGINVDDLPEMDFDASEQELYALRPGDILMCEGGEIGRCAIWDSDRRCFYQKALHRLRPTTDKDDPRYFVSVMRAAVEAGLFASRASAATIQHLPAEKLRVVRYAAPPIEEQRAIVEHIARDTTKLDAVRAATERTIALLKERRSALITAAVTGQLDVGAAG